MKQLREKTGLSTTQVGAAAGVSSSTVRDWEAGKYEPRARQVGALMNLFDVSFEDLLAVIKETLRQGGKS